MAAQVPDNSVWADALALPAAMTEMITAPVRKTLTMDMMDLADVKPISYTRRTTPQSSRS
jgi:hypothetical protein